MAWVKQREVSDTSATTSLAVSYGTATTAGWLLVAFVFSNAPVSSGAPAITGWTAGPSSGIGSAGVAGQVKIFHKISAGETTVTATSAGATSMMMRIVAYSGTANPVVVDGSNSANSGNTNEQNQVTGTVTTTNGGDLVLACVAQATSNGGVANGPGGAPWDFATILSASVATSKLICGAYLPGMVLTAFQDKAYWTTNRAGAGLIIAFSPPTVNGTLAAPITDTATLVGRVIRKGVLTAAVTDAAALTGRVIVGGTLTTALTDAFALGGRATVKGALTASLTDALAIAGTRVVKASLAAALSADLALSGTRVVNGTMTTGETDALLLTGQTIVHGVLTAALLDVLSLLDGKTTSHGTLAAHISDTLTMLGSVNGSGVFSLAELITANLAGKRVVRGTFQAAVTDALTMLGTRVRRGVLAAPVTETLALTGRIGIRAVSLAELDASFVLAGEAVSAETGAGVFAIPLHAAFGMAGTATHRGLEITTDLWGDPPNVGILTDEQASVLATTKADWVNWLTELYVED